jgi:hypothetical protein
MGGKPGKRRWRWLLRFCLPALLAVICLYVFRAPLLQSAGGFLVINEPFPAPDYVLLLDGDRRFDRAAELFHAGTVAEVLVIEARPNRLERQGLVPTRVEDAQRELRARKVPPGSFHVILGQAFTDWDRARCLSGWLGQHPDANLVVLCDALGSRRLRHIFHRVLGSEKSRQVHLQPLAHPWLEGVNWWQYRDGLVAVGTAYLRLGFVWLCAEGAQDAWREWDPEEYERALR